MLARRFSSSASIMVPLLLVVQLEQLDDVVVVAGGVGGVLGLLNLGHDVVKLGELLAFLVSHAKADTHLLGGVHAEGVHDISEEEEIHFTFAIPVIDIANLLDSIGINHFV